MRHRPRHNHLDRGAHGSGNWRRSAFARFAEANIEVVPCTEAQHNRRSVESLRCTWSRHRSVHRWHIDRRCQLASGLPCQPSSWRSTSGVLGAPPAAPRRRRRRRANRFARHHADRRWGCGRVQRRSPCAEGGVASCNRLRPVVIGAGLCCRLSCVGEFRCSFCDNISLPSRRSDEPPLEPTCLGLEHLYLPQLQNDVFGLL